MQIEILSRKDAARIRGVSERTIDRLCDTPDSGVRRVKLSLRRVGIIGAREVVEGDTRLSISPPGRPAKTTTTIKEVPPKTA